MVVPAPAPSVMEPEWGGAVSPDMLPLLLACIKTGPVYDNAAHLPSPALAGIFSHQDPEAIFDEAVARRADGDFEGAVHRLSWLIDNGHGSDAVVYQLGVAYELAGDYDTAISVYERLMLDPDNVLDAGFRRALCLESLDRWDEALRQYRRLPQTEGFDRHDRLTLDLAMGAAELTAGNERKGLRLVEEALAASEGVDDVTWIQGKARYALIDRTLDDAADLELTGSDKRIAKRLGERAAALGEAETHILAIIEHQEPEWILASLMRLGDAYLELHEDFLAVPPPDDVSAEVRAAYVEAWNDKAKVLEVKAFTAYDTALETAGKLRVDNRTTEALRERRDSIQL